MGAGNAALISLRALALLCTMAVVALTAWSKIIIIDIESRGASVVDTMIFNTEQDREAWRAFFSAVLDNGYKIWIGLGSSSFTLLATLTILLSNLFTKLHLTKPISLTLSALSTASVTASFAFTLSATLTLTNFTFDTISSSDTTMIWLDTSTSRDLKSFSAMLPLSQTYTIASGAAALLLLITTSASAIQIFNAARETKACSFEPTASSLGISHGYQAGAPRTASAAGSYVDDAGAYEPQKPRPVVMLDEEKGLIGGAAEMGGRSSRDGMGAGMRGDVDDGISGPMGLKKPEEAVLMRPARPWSEAPTQR